jgi:exosortase
MSAARLERPPTRQPIVQWQKETLVPLMVAGLAFLVLYAQPLQTLVRDWWTDPEAGHGLLLAPLAVWLAWQRGRSPLARPQARLGLFLLVAAVLLRYTSGLAAELFTMRMSLLGAVAAIIVMHSGLRQLVHWWLPASLLALSVPVPSVVMGTLALPLQLLASKMGAAMLVWRDVPVRLAGNVIHLPGQSLFVTEACSGLRSLTALLALGVLIGGLWLRHPLGRIVLLALAIPVAVLLNGVRVFLTGFLVYFVDPAFGEGFMHATEGWVVFVVAFLILGGVAWVVARIEAMSTRDATSSEGVQEAT